MARGRGRLIPWLAVLAPLLASVRDAPSAAARVETSSGTPVNQPGEYESYVKEVVLGVADSNVNGTTVGNFDEQERQVEEGRVLFAIVGTCPSMACKNQAVYFANFPSGVRSYWGKPGELKECTKSRHVVSSKGCKNDSLKFEALERLIESGQSAYRIDESLQRVVLVQGSVQLYIYLIYVSAWSAWHRTLDGWAIYQKSPRSSEYFRAQVRIAGDMALEFRGPELPLLGFWPRAEEVALPSAAARPAPRRPGALGGQSAARPREEALGRKPAITGLQPLSQGLQA